MDFQQYLLALQARRKVFLMVFAAILVTAVTVALLLPKRYDAVATVLLDARDEQTTAPGRVSPRERAGWVYTQVDMIQSGKVANRVARDLKLAQQPGVREQFESETGGVGTIEDWLGSTLLDTIQELVAWAGKHGNEIIAARAATVLIDCGAWQCLLPRRNRRTRSANEHATRKYSCTKRSACPMLVVSSGYRTRVIDSAASRSARALTNSPALNAWKSNMLGAAAAHRRSVLIVLPPYPTTGRSNGIPIRIEGRPAIARRFAPCASKEQASWISTCCSGRCAMSASRAASPIPMRISTSSRCRPMASPRA